MHQKIRAILMDYSPYITKNAAHASGNNALSLAEIPIGL